MKRMLFSLLMAVTMFITGCDDTLYEVYNGFTGPVESVALPATMSVEVHTTEKLKASVYPKMTDNKNVTWSSADSSIASVDADGVITGNIVNQSTVITVTTEEGGFTAQCKVTIVPKPIPITKLTLPETLSIGTGQQRTLSYSYTPSDATKATNSYMTWKSSNTAVAAVDGDGNVTGVSNGTATVTVKSTEWDKSAECTVTVGDPTYTITYNKNDGSGTVTVDSVNYKTGENFTVSAGTIFTRSKYIITGWNTKADGTGTPYSIGATYPVATSDINLYAQWDQTIFNVTYKANYCTSGTVPTDSGDYSKNATVTVKSNSGNLMKIPTAGAAEAFKFGGWNTEADGSGTNYAEGTGTFQINVDTILYAKWVKFELRDRGPSNGWIFYDKGSYSDGWRYLEAYTEDYTGSGGWSGAFTVFATYPSSGWYIPTKEEMKYMYDELVLYDDNPTGSPSSAYKFWVNSYVTSSGTPTSCYFVTFYTTSSPYSPIFKDTMIGSPNQYLSYRAIRKF